MIENLLIQTYCVPNAFTSPRSKSAAVESLLMLIFPLTQDSSADAFAYKRARDEECRQNSNADI